MILRMVMLYFFLLKITLKTKDMVSLGDLSTVEEIVAKLASHGYSLQEN